MTKGYEVTTGGKLYLAGEYAILTPGQRALIKYIPICMKATIEPSQTYQLFSDMFDYGTDLTPDTNYALIQETIQVVNDYLVQLGLSPQPFSLKITGKLEKNGKKIGIGSSGSVVLLTIKAMAKLYQLDLSADQLFRLATYVLLKRGDNGSMGDLACIAYEELVAFTSFNRQQVRNWIEQTDLLTVLTADWGYEIRPVKVNLSCDFLVGWTGRPAISKELIERVRFSIGPDFLQKTQIAVEDLEQGLCQGNQNQVMSSLATLGHLLQELHPAIYSPDLQALVAATEGLVAVAKSSGAGGGDCGLALSFDSASSHHLFERWKKAGIELLWQEVLA